MVRAIHLVERPVRARPVPTYPAAGNRGDVGAGEGTAVTFALGGSGYGSSEVWHPHIRKAMEMAKERGREGKKPGREGRGPVGGSSPIGD